MLQFQVVRVSFPQKTGIEQTLNGGVNFPNPVKSVGLALNGYDISYTNGDHHLLELKIDCSNAPFVSGARVDFSVTFLLRDGSGKIDDPYKGWVDVLVIAEV